MKARARVEAVLGSLVLVDRVGQFDECLEIVAVGLASDASRALADSSASRYS
ncbi:MAG: hypothetical protein WDM88_01675 [Galbitalea sp.]